MMKKIIALTLAFILCLSLAGCSTSVKSLEEKLAKHTWYREYKSTYGGMSLEVLEFHLDGKRVSRKYNKSHSGQWTGAGNVDNLSNSWQIMDNKELLFKGKYYDWGDEWDISGGTLVIGEYVYTNEAPENFSK